MRAQDVALRNGPFKTVDPTSTLVPTAHHVATSKALRLLELGLLLGGVVLCGWYAERRIFAHFQSQRAVMNYQSGPPQLTSLTGGTVDGGHVDFSLWSPGRISAYQKNLTATISTPIAVLRIPKVHLEVPVFDGTDDVALDLGVGRIVGTSRPGELGNIGIAGHRDGFFRGLKDITSGDTVELVTHEKTQVFLIERTEVVDPNDVRVLGMADTPTLTLVTCYPFYHVGSAPQRFIAHAELSREVLRGDAE